MTQVSTSVVAASAPTQRAVLRLVRVRASRVASNGAIVCALPCHNYYDVYPDEIGPTGNVVVTNAQELQSWLLVARTVSPEEAQQKGGCITYTPPTAYGETQYYCITDSDDVVYGRAAYLPHPPSRRCSVRKDGCAAPSSRRGSSSSVDALTDDTASTTSLCEEKVLP